MTRSPFRKDERIHILSLEIYEGLGGFEASVTVRNADKSKKKFRIGICSESVFVTRLRDYLRYQQE